MARIVAGVFLVFDTVHSVYQTSNSGSKRNGALNAMGLLFYASRHRKHLTTEQNKQNTNEQY